MYVYNVDDDVCREVTIKPNSKWGGDGSLGCGIGYGYLHRIPVRELPAETKPLFRMPVTVNQSAPVAGTDPTVPYVPPLLNVFPSVSAGSDQPMIGGAISAPAGPAMTAAVPSPLPVSSGVFGAPTPTSFDAPVAYQALVNPEVLGVASVPPAATISPSPPAEQQTHIFGVPPMPPTTIPYSAAPAASTPGFFGVPPASVDVSVSAPAPQLHFSQTGGTSSFPPVPTLTAAAPLTYATYGQAFTQATVPVPSSLPASIQQVPMSIPTYASCPQTTPLSTMATPFGVSSPPIPTTFNPAPTPPQQGSTMSIALPGMPPLTVSATIPAQTLEGLRFGPPPPVQQP